MAPSLARCLTRLLDTVFPPRCLSPGCDRRGAWICAPCLAAAPRPPAAACTVCGDAVIVAAPGPPRCRRCLAHPPAFASAVAPWRHAHPVTAWIHGLKYDRRRGVAAGVAPAMAAALGRFPTAPSPAVVVPVPTHPLRRARRGIDVPACLASALAAALDAGQATPALVRTADTPPQVGASRAARLANLRGAIAATTRLDGHHVVLVDDVLTTGATAEACAQALAAAGAAAVTVVTVARATRPSGAADRLPPTALRPACRRPV